MALLLTSLQRPGYRAEAMEWAWRPGITTMTGFVIFSLPITVSPSSTTTTVMGHFQTLPRAPKSRPKDGLAAPVSLIMTTMVIWTCSCAVICGGTSSREASFAASTNLEDEPTAILTSFSRFPTTCSRTMETGLSPT